jgi:hypothetical protein
MLFFVIIQYFLRSVFTTFYVKFLGIISEISTIPQ